MSHTACTKVLPEPISGMTFESRKQTYKHSQSFDEHAVVIMFKCWTAGKALFIQATMQCNVSLACETTTYIHFLILLLLFLFFITAFLSSFKTNCPSATNRVERNIRVM